MARNTHMIDGIEYEMPGYVLPHMLEPGDLADLLESGIAIEACRGYADTWERAAAVWAGLLTYYDLDGVIGALPSITVGSDGYYSIHGGAVGEGDLPGLIAHLGLVSDQPAGTPNEHSPSGLTVHYRTADRRVSVLWHVPSTPTEVA